jgi:Radical SAM superfamily/Iron-sulfur cluster-binding domain
MRPFDARTTSSQEADVMRALAALQREALAAPRHAAELFERARALLPPLPLKVQIQTTTRCNAACAMCPYPLVTAEPEFEHAVMSEDRYRRILDDLRGGAVERLSLFLMNEPLLDTRLPRWVALAREALPATTLGLFSNGAALDGKRARALAEAGLDELCVSVHGFDAATYERVMQGLSFPRLQRNLADVLAADARGELGAMHLEIVTGDVPEVAASLAQVPDRLRDRVVLKAFSNERAAVGVATDLPSSVRPGGGSCAAAAAVCQRLFVKLYVLTSGDCVLCNVDWRRTVLLGRVGDAGGPSVAEVWRGDAYTDVRRDHFLRAFERAALCRRCDYATVVDRE